ncbi:MAG: thioredoxin [Oligoflexales bacterium]
MSQTISINDKDFDQSVLKSEKPVLVDFWAPWCGPCVALAPTLEEAAKEYGDNLTIAKLNVEENTDTPVSYGVRSIPYLVLFKNGEVVTTHSGNLTKAQLKELIDNAL